MDKEFYRPQEFAREPEVTAGQRRHENPYDMPLTDRAFDTYLDEMALSKEDLGHTVLDLGSGLTESFAREAKLYGINVYSVSPHLKHEQIRQDRQRQLDKEKEWDDFPLPDLRYPPIAAKAEALPFRDQLFDTVISYYAVPMYVPRENLSAAFKEIYRVLKDGGKAFLAPIAPNVDMNFSTQEIQGALDSLSMHYELKPINHRVGPRAGDLNYYVLTLHKRS